jgi:hypothetical protein
MPYKHEDQTSNIIAYYENNSDRHGFLPPANGRGTLGSWLNVMKNGQGGSLNESEANTLRGYGFEDYITERLNSKNEYTLKKSTPTCSSRKQTASDPALTPSTAGAPSVAAAARSDSSGVFNHPNKSPYDREMLDRFNIAAGVFKPSSGPSGPSR